MSNISNINLQSVQKIINDKRKDYLEHLAHYAYNKTQEEQAAEEYGIETTQTAHGLKYFTRRPQPDYMHTVPTVPMTATETAILWEERWEERRES
jgi:hypothetical protein